jgi:hypothetical protein
MGQCPGKEIARAALQADVKNDVSVIRILSVPVSLPVSRVGIELYASSGRRRAVDGDGRIGKVRAGFVIPHAELHDAHRITFRRCKLASKIACKPMGLQLELREPPWDSEKRPLTSAARVVTRCKVTVLEGDHLAEIRKRFLAKKARRGCFYSPGPARTAGRRLALGATAISRSKIRRISAAGDLP